MTTSDESTIYSTASNQSDQLHSRHVQPRPTTSKTPWTLRPANYRLRPLFTEGDSVASNQSRVNRGVSGTREVPTSFSHNSEGTLFTLDVLDGQELPPSITQYNTQNRKTTRPRGSGRPWTWLDVAGWFYV